MIKSKQDYLEYVKADRKALGRENRVFPLVLLDMPLRYQLALRRAEYYNNCYTHFYQKPLVLFARLRHRMLGNRCGYSIPLNVCGKGLNLAHLGTVVINAGATIGEYCRIHVDVNIGTSAGAGNKAPRIGDRVYIAPGAKLFGEIEIGNDTVIGANAVVNKSFPEGGITIGGIPAKKISDKGSDGLLYAPQAE